MKLSKTTVFAILAIAGTVLSVFANALGLTIDPSKVLLGVAAVLTYVFGALKTDLAGLNQPGVWRDPKVWIAAASALLAGLASAGVQLPIAPELIIAVLTAILGFLFKPAEVARSLRARAARVNTRSL